jgi:hypothetical protein
MNWAIVFAIVIQSLVGKVSRLLGAIVGCGITTGILIWGLSAYAAGDRIGLLGMGLSKGVFIGACVLWYLFDAAELKQAWKTRNAVEDLAEVPEGEPAVQAANDNDGLTEGQG